MTTTSITAPAARALTDLVDTARALTDEAERLRLHMAAGTLRGVAKQLDAVRTRLVQDGAEFMDEAWAFVVGGRRVLANHSILIERQKARRA